MRVAVPAILIAILLGAVSLSTQRAGPRAEFTFIHRASVHTLDPAQMSYSQDIRLAQALWEGLTRLHPRTTAPIEGAARLPPEISSDGMRYVFTLRDEARWSNGDPVTAADFVRGWRRAIEPGTADVYAELVTDYIAGAREYVTWRTEQMEVLQFVRLLEDGSPVSGASLARLVDRELAAPLRDMLATALPQPRPPAEAAFWVQAAERLAASGTDWRKLGDALLDRHIAQMAERFGAVGVRALGDHHLEVRLTRPAAYFLDLTAFPTYMPIHRSIELLRERYDGRPLHRSGIWAVDSQWTKPQYPRAGYPGLISNGPYRLADWAFKKHVLLEANPYYWAAAEVRAKSVKMLDIEYKNTAFMLYDQGHADLLADLDMDYTPELVELMRTGKRGDIHAIPAFGTYYYNINCRPFLPAPYGMPNPLADARVRRALAMAIDKRLITEHVERLGNPVATTLVPRGQIPGYHSPEGLAHDPSRARRELADAGYPAGAGLPVLEILFNTNAGHDDTAQAIKRMWEQELGVQVRLVSKETKTFAEDKAMGRFMITRSGWFGDYRDPTTWLDLLHSNNGHNHGGFTDPQYDALLEEAWRETDAARRMELLTRAERYLVEEQMPDIPLYVYVMVYAWRPNVTGIYPNPRIQFPLEYISVDGGGRG
ncbi:MAG: hypothetical protein AMXMBFR13_12880 [Phycisphaerae bacterium]